LLRQVTSVQLSDSGVHLLSSSKDNSVRLWDIRSARPLRSFKGHQNSARNFVRARFGPSKGMLYSGSEDGSVCIWDMESAQLLQRLHGHQDVVYEARARRPALAAAAPASPRAPRPPRFRTQPPPATPAGRVERERLDAGELLARRRRVHVVVRLGEAALLRRRGEQPVGDLVAAATRACTHASAERIYNSIAVPRKCIIVCVLYQSVLEYVNTYYLRLVATLQ
jgi:hypothetical protein